MRFDVVRVACAMLLAGILAGCATGGGHHLKSKSSDKEKAAQVHTQLGQGYFRQGDLKTAIEKLHTALTFDPNYAPAHTVLGAVYERLHQLPEAEKHYRRAVQLHPKDGDTNNNFGVFLCREGKVDEAMPYFRKALADPFYGTPAAAWTNAGICQIRAGNYQQAEEHLGKALEVDSRYPDALYQMARALHLSGDNFRASAYIQRYQTRGRSSAEALKLGYDIETRLGDAEGARDYARQLRSKFPDSEQARATSNTTTP